MTSRSLCKLFIISTPICSERERDALKLTAFFPKFDYPGINTGEQFIRRGLSLQSCGQPGLISLKGF